MDPKPRKRRSVGGGRGFVRPASIEVGRREAREQLLQPRAATTEPQQHIMSPTDIAMFQKTLRGGSRLVGIDLHMDLHDVGETSFISSLVQNENASAEEKLRLLREASHKRGRHSFHSKLDGCGTCALLRLCCQP